MMAGGRIYWEPDGGALRSIDVAGFSYWDEIPFAERVDQRTYQGRAYRQLISDGLRVRVGVEAFAAGDLERKLMSLYAHLLGGGSIGISAEREKAWLGYVFTSLSQDATTVRTGSNVGHETSAVMPSGDDARLESLDERFRTEVVNLAAQVDATDRSVSLSGAGVQYQHGGVIWLRHRYYLPVAYWPASEIGTPFVIPSPGRRVFTFDMTLELAIGGMMSIQAEGDAPFDLGFVNGGTPGSSRPTKSDLLNGRTGRGAGSNSPFGTTPNVGTVPRWGN